MALGAAQHVHGRESAALSNGSDDAAGNRQQEAAERDAVVRAIAEAFVRARREGAALAGFPGAIPDDLVAAYRVQDLAIAQWPDQVIGWKVGYIQPQRRDASGDERLLGPIFRRQVWPAAGVVEFPVFVGGFAAVEAEYVLRLLADAPPGKTAWTPQEAAALPATLHVGIEIASSPLATINALGPCVVVSDFGNNNGLILGDQIADWHAIPEERLRAETWIDGECVGTGGATFLPGGLLAAYAFALSRSAQRRRPLRAGELIATGNATGIHDIVVGQAAQVRFEGHGVIDACAVVATAQDNAT